MSMHSPLPDACTTCTICVTHCPVARATRKFRGPKLVGPSYERFRLAGYEDEASLEYCSNCKNCEIACPSEVPVATFTMQARAAYCQKHTPPLRDWILAHSGYLGHLAAHVPAFLLNLGTTNPIFRQALDHLGIDRRAPMPSFAPLAERRALKEKHPAKITKKTVVFFPGCFIRYYSPRIGLDCMRLLELGGYEVIVPEAFECCGLPLVAGGYLEDARKAARRNQRELARWTEQGVPVVTACPSCALMLKQEYRTLFPEENFCSPKILDACALVSDLIRAGVLPVDKSPHAKYALAYHAPCHLRALGGGSTGLELLKLLPGLEALDMEAECCGISGSYGFKKGKYEIGMKIGAPLFANIKKSGALLAASECGTCRLQITHGSGLTAKHPLSIALEAASGIPGRA